MVQDCFWKNVFWTHFSPIFAPKAAPFQGILGFSMGQNPSQWAQNGLKTFVCASKMVQDHFWKKRVLDPFLTLFWSLSDPFSTHFGIFHGPKRVQMGSKWAKSPCLSIPNGPGSLLEKRVFDPFLTLFWSQNDPFSRHFGIFHGPKRATSGSKRPKNTSLSIPSGLGTTLDKIFFSPRGPWWTHRWPPLCTGRAALRLHQVTTGSGI